jgi:hypothetical protein
MELEGLKDLTAIDRAWRLVNRGEWRATSYDSRATDHLAPNGFGHGTDLRTRRSIFLKRLDWSLETTAVSFGDRTERLKRRQSALLFR